MREAYELHDLSRCRTHHRGFGRLARSRLTRIDWRYIGYLEIFKNLVYIGGLQQRKYSLRAVLLNIDPEIVRDRPEVLY